MGGHLGRIADVYSADDDVTCDEPDETGNDNENLVSSLVGCELLYVISH